MQKPLVWCIEQAVWVTDWLEPRRTREGEVLVTPKSDLAATRDLRWATDRNLTIDPIRQWREVVSRGIGELDVTTTVGREFTAHWQRVDLGPVDLHCLVAAPLRVVRSDAMVARYPSPEYNLLYIRKGLADLSHCGRHVQVTEGSFVLLNNQYPFDLKYAGSSEVLSGHFSDKWLRRWVAYPEQMEARPISGEASWGRPLAALLISIAEGGLAEAGLPRCAIADQCGALLALMAGACSAFTSRHGHELLMRLKRVLHNRFQEAALTPSQVADSAGISKRHLHGLFAAAGTTFGSTLFEIRLESARSLLSSPHYRGYTVGDIARQCGFADPSHFARRFRSQYGISPVGFRKRSPAAFPA